MHFDSGSWTARGCQLLPVQNFIENIRLNTNSTTRITPFEAHFDRKHNTDLSNILTTLSHKKLKLSDKNLIFI